MHLEKENLFQKYILGSLIYTIMVILWGAFVRISFSGDGCGDHWPLCHGEVLPSFSSSKTIVELTHRITSMVAWFLALGGCFLVRKYFPPKHLARRGAYITFFLMCTEALVGAGLVLFKMVAYNESVARGWWISVHLLNTFFLLAAFTFTFWASFKEKNLPPFSIKHGWIPVGLMIALLLSGMSGAIAALGDALFPVSNLETAIAEDFSPSAHIFIRLRILHPVIALITAVILGSWLIRIANNFTQKNKRTWIYTLLVLIGIQISCGFLNVILMAPLWLQIMHLFIADLIWIQTIWWILENIRSTMSLNQG